MLSNKSVLCSFLKTLTVALFTIGSVAAFAGDHAKQEKAGEMAEKKIGELKDMKADKAAASELTDAEAAADAMGEKADAEAKMDDKGDKLKDKMKAATADE